ncbi:hypothetical protein DES53_11851 [Roseimicrobium gellanilyticum]|uniref:Uncharacterized protein n=1 Tax=Roseimicrobium gellanilyticum TaxID=748857 RepID=A0A366H2H3_9BACT|nr:hypothetical protein [Roseimicrobium gellanilyticum]RBP36102.1 hypothetical protein DES53_11851 [Roseimicrobium gellanilyticum]
MSAQLHLLPHPEWTCFRESLVGLDGKSLWLTVNGHRKGPYRIAILGAGMGAPACRRYAIELIPDVPDELQPLYLDPQVADHITGMKGGRGKMMELDLDEVAPSTAAGK